MKVYLASPYGFAESTRAYLGSIKTVLTKARIQVVDPWEIGAKLLTATRVKSAMESKESLVALHNLSSNLAELNRRAIDGSDVVIAGLDGPDIDSGTASEIGYAFAMGKLVLGLRSDIRRSGENEGVRINLQVQYWIEKSGGQVVESIHDLLPLLSEPRKRPAAGPSVARPPET